MGISSTFVAGRRQMRLGLAGVLLACIAGAASAQPVPTNANSTAAPTSTMVLQTGPADQRLDIAVIGDGFQAGADQTTFNNYVQQELLTDLFSQGLLWETRGAFNIRRINTFSRDSGVTQVNRVPNPSGTGSTATVTTNRRTALDWRVNGQNRFCWNEGGPNQNAFQSAIINALAPEADFIVVVLNEPTGGGCARGSMSTLHLPSGDATIRHELGHAVANLCDEYVANAPTTYTGGEPGCANLTINTNRASIKWGRYIPSDRALPTTFASPMDADESAGAFVGGSVGAGNNFNAGIWRPTDFSTMRDNRLEYGPVNYEQMRTRINEWLDYSFDDAVVGDFNGDGRDDVVIQDDISLWLHLSAGNSVTTDFSASERIPGSWQFQDGDRLHVGDFNGDGRDDLFIANLTNWSIPYVVVLRSTGTGFEFVRRYDANMPGWEMRGGDRFQIGDFDNDGRDDVIVFNGDNWSIPYLGMLRSTGSGLAMARRYDANMPGWEMRRGDKHAIGDFDNDGRDDVIVFNGENWSIAYLGMLRSTGSALSMARRYDANMPGWEMRRGDKHFVGDFDNDGRDDLYVFNGDNWSVAYLGMLRSTGSALSMARRYDENAPGWQMRRGDKHFIADINGDGRDDLYVYNSDNWSTQYLGALRSNGSSLSGSWQDDWIGSWNLGPSDRFLVGNFNGGSGWDDIIIRNSGWLGLLRSQGASLSQVALYRNWIHDVEFHQFGWW